jgi:hypothetical protein
VKVAPGIDDLFVVSASPSWQSSNFLLNMIDDYLHETANRAFRHRQTPSIQYMSNFRIKKQDLRRIVDPHKEQDE